MYSKREITDRFDALYNAHSVFWSEKGIKKTVGTKESMMVEDVLKDNTTGRIYLKATAQGKQCPKTPLFFEALQSETAINFRLAATEEELEQRGIVARSFKGLR